jgi:hypothetical protein
MSITSDLVKITPDVATQFLGEKYSYEFNRKVKDLHVEFLADAMIKGRFDPTAQIAFVRIPNDKDYLINGQHTLNAIIKSDLPQTLNVVRYTVSSYDEVHSLFSHYDIGSLRTFADSVRAFGVANSTGLNHTQITQTAAALRYMKSGFPRGAAQIKKSSEDMIKLIHDWNEEALLIFNLLAAGEKKVNRRLKTSAVLSVLLVIMKYNPAKGAEFISQVASDDGLKVGDPRKALNRYLRDTSKNVEATGKKLAVNGQLARACAKSWNKFIGNVNAKNINIRREEISKPIVIKGTPYTGVHKTIG